MKIWIVINILGTGDPWAEVAAFSSKKEAEDFLKHYKRGYWGESNFDITEVTLDSSDFS